MKMLIRASLMALNLAIGIPVAYAADGAVPSSTAGSAATNSAAPIQQDSTASWANG